MRRLAGLVAVVAALVAAAPAHAALPPIKHVFVIWMENKDYDETFAQTDPKAPYLAKTLPAMGALLPEYHAIGHLSLDNYIAVVSGQGPNPQTQADCQAFTEFVPGTPGPDGQAMGSGCVYPASVETIADQLEAKGLTWKGYMEDMGLACRHPEVGAADDTQSATAESQYAARHNPFVYFHSIIDEPSCAQNDVDLSRLEGDIAHVATTASYNFITPDLCNDGHDEPCVDGQRPGGLESINAFLEEWVPKILASPGFRDDGLLVVSFDEAETEHDASACCNEQAINTPNAGGPTPGPGGGKIGAVLISPFIRPGTVDETPYNHYSFLRTTEDMFGLPHLGYAGVDGLEPIGDKTFTNPTPQLDMQVKARRVRPHRVRLRIDTGREATVSFGGVCRRTRERTTSEAGSVRVTVRHRRRGHCRIEAARPGWQSAKKSYKLRSPRQARRALRHRRSSRSAAQR